MLDVCISGPKLFYEALHNVCFSTIGMGIIYQIDHCFVDANQNILTLLKTEQEKENILQKLLAHNGEPFNISLRLSGKLKIFRVWPHRFRHEGKIYQLSLLKCLR